jgi:DNA mismatch repair protein MutL
VPSSRSAKRKKKRAYFPKPLPSDLNKIHVLPEHLIRLIAAGEVIERPASVVKELVENSLDAGATSISIDLWSAGRTRIRVSDNGEGMTPEDARQALERHATSKLQNFEDLQSMATFGFRGEALPSIAAISRLELSTRPRDAPEGWTLKLEGGKLLSANGAGIPPGTTIDVQDLFFNTPARSKFLKRDSTERSHVLRTLQDIALAHPNVHFEMTMDGKSILSLPPAKELGQRIADLWGLSVTEELVRVQISKGPCTIRGFVNATQAHHATKAHQSLFVNNRPVFQRMLNHAVYEAYKEWLPVGRHPIYCLFVDLDPTLVDVNVHPAKREVRISEERAVYDLLYASIRERFKEKSAEVPSIPFSARWAEGLPKRESFTPRDIGTSIAVQPPLVLDIPQAASPKIEVASLRFLGQLQKLYLLFEQGEELILVDQHAAAERILYERLLAQVSTQGVARQSLLAPLLWEVSPAQAETVRSYLADLHRMGFSLEEFGPNSFVLKEWPVVLPETKHAKQFLEEVLESYQNEHPASQTDIQHRIAASAACRAAVMANDTLSPQEVTRLVEDLSACERPMTCPHGRPTNIRLPVSEFNRRFRRT